MLDESFEIIQCTAYSHRTIVEITVLYKVLSSYWHFNIGFCFLNQQWLTFVWVYFKTKSLMMNVHVILKRGRNTTNKQTINQSSMEQAISWESLRRLRTPTGSKGIFKLISQQRFHFLQLIEVEMLKALMTC